MANLDSYTSVRSHVYVRLAIDEYRTTSSGSYTPQVLRFTDDPDTRTIDGETYTSIGRLLGVTATASELRPTDNSITVTISGIPTNAIQEIVYSRIKGSNIKIYRQFYTVAGSYIATQGYFFGRVNNYSLQEDYRIEERTANNIILLDCSSNIEVLKQKISGRKTNPQSEQRFFPSDTAMNRVPTIKGTKFDFGAP
jgi:hypothetical protein